MCCKHEGISFVSNPNPVLLVDVSSTVTGLDEPPVDTSSPKFRVRFSRTKLVSRRELNLLGAAGPTVVVEGCLIYFDVYQGSVWAEHLRTRKIISIWWPWPGMGPHGR